MLRTFFTLLLTLMLATTAMAQNVRLSDDDVSTVEQSPAVTTLEDILRRQQGLAANDSERQEVIGNPDGMGTAAGPLGTLGGASDADLWRAYRFNEADITTQVRGPAANVLVQDGGMWWLNLRRGPLQEYGAYLLGGTIVLLALFFLIRGRIRIDGPKTGRTVERFKAVERFGHWLLAGSFILLGLTGLISLFGRVAIIPFFEIFSADGGKAAYATLALWSKWIHNNVSWAFMIALVMIFVMWVAHNLPDRTDLKWLAKGGGIFTKSHPPAKKFNAGQKLIFWSVIVLGASISASGLALLFPFELNMFAATFAKVNATGLPEAVGYGALPETLAPHEEMQYAQLWHAIVSFVLMAIILAHIYIGSLGMEGAYDAMGSGEVEEQWAREHHSIWAAEKLAEERQAPGNATPAE